MTCPAPPLALTSCIATMVAKAPQSPATMSARARLGEHRRLPGKPVLRGITRHRLHEAAESGMVGIRAGLPPAGHAHDHQRGIDPQQLVRAEAHLLERSHAEALEEDIGGAHQLAQDLLALLRAQVEGQALLVPRIDLPVGTDALRMVGPGLMPGTQRVALLRVLDLQHLRAEIGQGKRHHVARHEAAQVQHANPVEGTTRRRIEAAGLEGEHLLQQGHWGS